MQVSAKPIRIVSNGILPLRQRVEIKDGNAKESPSVDLSHARSLSSKEVTESAVVAVRIIHPDPCPSRSGQLPLRAATGSP